MGDENVSYICPSWAAGLGFLGCAAAVCFASKLPVVSRDGVYFPNDRCWLSRT